MNGGSITGNTTERGGGGVYLSSGSFTLTGGSIQNNQAGTLGGGIILAGEAEFTVSGAPVITGNTASGKGYNPYLAGATCVSCGSLWTRGPSFLWPRSALAGR